MFGRLSADDRRIGREFLIDEARVLARLSEDNKRYQTQVSSGGMALSAARLQYYLHRLTLVEESYFLDSWLVNDSLPKVCRPVLAAHIRLIDAEVFFSRLRYLFSSPNDVFPVSSAEVANWMERVKEAAAALERENLIALKKLGLDSAEWLSTLRQIESQAAAAVPEVQRAAVESEMADLLWRAAFVWSLGVGEEAEAGEKRTDQLFTVAAVAYALRAGFGPDETSADNANLDVICAVVVEESIQRFHNSIRTGKTPLGQVAGFVGRVEYEYARDLYHRYWPAERAGELESELIADLSDAMSAELAEVAVPLLLERQG